MSSDSAVPQKRLIDELFSSVIYKRNQGRLVRQLTCIALWVAVGISAYRFHETYMEGQGLVGNILSASIAAAGAWVSYRLVNWPKFAEFLISVEAELNKVSWPSWTELVRASLVVIFSIFFLTGVLFAFDALWQALFSWLGIT